MFGKLGRLVLKPRSAQMKGNKCTWQQQMYTYKKKGSSRLGHDRQELRDRGMVETCAAVMYIRSHKQGHSLGGLREGKEMSVPS